MAKSPRTTPKPAQPQSPAPAAVAATAAAEAPDADRLRAASTAGIDPFEVLAWRAYPERTPPELVVVTIAGRKLRGPL